MGQVERRLTLALGLPAGASLSRVCAAVEARVLLVQAPSAELEAIDGALGYDEHDTRHDGDRVERIEELQERLLCAEQDRDRVAAKLVETQKELAQALAESAHLALDLGPGPLDPRSERAIGIALDRLGEASTDPTEYALIGVVRALCGIGTVARWEVVG